MTITKSEQNDLMDLDLEDAIGLAIDEQLKEVQWVKYDKYQGAKVVGDWPFEIVNSHSNWDKILGVVASCEGNLDTVQSFDRAGLSVGMTQWTMLSGRAQQLFEYFKSVPIINYNLGEEDHNTNVFEECFCFNDGSQIFEAFGFIISQSKMYDIENSRFLLTSNTKDQKRIYDICLGKAFYKDFKDQKKHAKKLALAVSQAMGRHDARLAQVEFAKLELKRSCKVKRLKHLKQYDTIENLLEGTWETPIPAIFFNLWQNSPAGAYRLFMNAYKDAARKDNDLVRSDGMRKIVNPGREMDLLEVIWDRLNRTKYANWSYNGGMYQSGKTNTPRIVRLKGSIKEYYDIDLKVVKAKRKS